MLEPEIQQEIEGERRGGPEHQTKGKGKSEEEADMFFQLF